jgi:hypothetical protein
VTVRLQLVLPGVEAEADGEAAAPAPAPAPAHALICPRASAIAPGHRAQGQILRQWCGGGHGARRGARGWRASTGAGAGRVTPRRRAGQGRAGCRRTRAEEGRRRAGCLSRHTTPLSVLAGAEAGAGARRRRRPLWRRGWVGTAKGAREAGLQVDCRW